MSIDQVWAALDISNAQYTGVLEFQDDKDEWHNFVILKTCTRLLFGSACNVGFLVSGYMMLDENAHLGENLQELLVDLETFYNDGPSYTRKIVFNERM